MTWKSLCPNLPCLFGDSALMVWPPHMYRIWPRQKYSCTVRSIISLRQGDIIARTPLYARLPTDTPTRTRFFWFTSNAFLKRPVLLNWRLLRPFSMRKPHAKAVPRKDFFTHLRTLKNARKRRWVISPNYCTSHPQCFWAVGDNSHSMRWHPLGLTLRRMPCGRGTLRIPLQRIL